MLSHSLPLNFVSQRKTKWGFSIRITPLSAFSARGLPNPRQFQERPIIVVRGVALQPPLLKVHWFHCPAAHSSLTSLVGRSHQFPLGPSFSHHSPPMFLPVPCLCPPFHSHAIGLFIRLNFLPFFESLPTKKLKARKGCSRVFAT